METVYVVSAVSDHGTYVSVFYTLADANAYADVCTHAGYTPTITAAPLVADFTKR